MLAAVTVTATGCTATVPGEPRQAPYRPLSIGSITATMADPVADAAAYSPDGSLAAIRTHDGVCIQPMDRSGGAAGKDRVCADLGTTIGQVLFSPDGSTVAALEYRQATYRGRLWLISVDDGDARRVTPLEEQGSGTSGSTGAAGTTGTDRIPSSSAAPSDASEVPYTSIAWPAQGSLLGLAVTESGEAHLMRVDPASATTSDLGTVTPGDSGADGTLLAGGGVALVPLIRTPHGPPRLVVVDLTNSETHTLMLTGDMITDSTQVMPLAVAPDGHSALLWVIDQVNFVLSPPVQGSLRTGSLMPVDGADDLIPIAAGYSPGGSQIALIASGPHDKRNSLFVMPTDGGTPRALTVIDAEITPGTGLAWTSTNLLVPHAAGGAISLDGLAPWQLSG